ncbi:MAG: hypothetical protein U1E67_23580 [Hyphomicrobiales bacterium]
MLDPTKLLSGLPAALRAELLQSFEAIASNYAEHKWGPAELNGAKFCEVMYSILQGTLVGPMPAKASKPANIVLACQNLEKVAPDPTRVGDRSLRILIPRMIPPLYEIRNNRNVGHVGGDVDPNFMDATAVYGMASWMLAELIRIFHNVPTNEAQEVVDTLVERKHPLIWEVGGQRRILEPSMPPKDQVLVHLHGKATWVAAKDLTSWIEYSTVGNLRAKILKTLHTSRLIEFDSLNDRARLSPLGAKDVEDRILKPRTP